MTSPSPSLPPALTRPVPARSRAIAALAALLLAALGLFVAPPATAAVGNTYSYNGATTGTALRFNGVTGTVANQVTRFYVRTGTDGFAGYALNTAGVSPTGAAPIFTEADWAAAGLSEAGQANRGPVEWIVKTGFSGVSGDETRVTNLAGISGYVGIGDVAAATQAAIWYYTEGLVLNPATTSAGNNSNIQRIYAYLVTGAAGQAATVVTAPTVDVTALDNRTAFSIVPGSSFGPFTVASSNNVTLSLTPASGARIVDATGTPLTGSQAPGTTFYIEPTGSPVVDGAVTVRAQGATVSGKVLNPVLPPATGGFRTFARLSDVTYPAANDSLAVTWVIDANDPGAFDPACDATERTYEYTPPVIKSATLEDLNFTDGTSTTVDLIGLRGTGSTSSASVYAADFDPALYSNNGPTLPISTFTEAAWELGKNPEAHQNAAQVTWLLQNSYPELDTAALTAAARAAGFNPSTGNVKNYSAIAATQAAIWHYTDGLDLDTTRYLDPTAALASSTAPASTGAFAAENLLDGATTTGWRASDNGEATIDFTFPVPVELRSYSLSTLEGGAAANTPASWKLQRSVDGSVWSDVSTSATTATFPGGASQTKQTNLGGSATYGGYAHYRLVITGADAAEPVEFSGIHFNGFGVFGSQPNYRYAEFANTAEVVALYKYLVAGSAGAVSPTPWTVAITSSQTTFQRENTDEVVGPFTYQGSSSAIITASGAEGVKLLATADGALVDELLLVSGDTFWVYPGEGDAAEIELAVSGSAQNWVSARALNGVTRAQAETLTLTQLGIASRVATSSLIVSVEPLPEPTLTLSIPEGERGDSVTVTGTGFGASENVALWLNSDPLALGTVETNDEGGFTAEVTIPQEAVIGDHHVQGVGAATSRSAQAPFAVLATEVVDGGEGETTPPAGGGEGETTPPTSGGESETTPVDGGSSGTTGTTGSEVTSSTTASSTPSATAAAEELSSTGASASVFIAAIGGVLALGIGATLLARRKIASELDS